MQDRFSMFLSCEGTLLSPAIFYTRVLKADMSTNTFCWQSLSMEIKLESSDLQVYESNLQSTCKLTRIHDSHFL